MHFQTSNPPPKKATTPGPGSVSNSLLPHMGKGEAPQAWSRQVFTAAQQGRDRPLLAAEQQAGAREVRSQALCPGQGQGELAAHTVCLWTVWPPTQLLLVLAARPRGHSSASWPSFP